MKKIISFLLLPALLFAQTIWDGTADSAWYTANKSAQSYKIANARQLAGLAVLVNSGSATFSGKTITLDANIILNDTAGWRSWNSGSGDSLKQWIPIGSSGKAFRGNFDGKGYVVTGLYINSTADNQGLFGVAFEGDIRNVGLAGFYVRGKNNVGGIVGGTSLCAGFDPNAEVLHYGKMKKQFCDERDGKRYVYVDIGSQRWMAENLNYDIPGNATDVCYNNNPSNCVVYGKLYNWATAMVLPSNCNSSTCASQVQSKHQGICPVGWHIPSDTEWNTLLNDVGGSSMAGTKLKAESSWLNENNGTDGVGFSALPNGLGSGNSFYNMGDRSFWWIAKESADIYAWGQNIYDDGNTPQHIFGKNGLLSVRCLKDASDLPLSVPNGTITNSYAIGNVSGTDSVGGIRGFGGMVENSYFTGKVTGNNAGGIIGAVAACTGADNANGKYCSKGVMKNYDTFTDERDGKVYRKVDIGAQTWMAENLNYDTTAGSVCYGNDHANCGKYGKLYNWETATKVCPSGWHLPSDAEWQRLVNFVGDSTAGTRLKAASGWDDYNSNSGNGIDDYGFSALPNGHRPFGNAFMHIGKVGSWWSDSSSIVDSAWIWDVGYDFIKARKLNRFKSHLFGVRCVNDTVPAPFGTLIDNRNGKNTKYITVDIGTQKWMAENLNYDTTGSVCYESKPENCDKYGKLYNWETAMKACPPDWRLPTNDEWDTLVNFVGGESVAGMKLKASSWWKDNGNGTNNFGFSALPGGRLSGSAFNYLGELGRWWTTEQSGDAAYLQYMDYNGDGIGRTSNAKTNYLSVRCLHNTPVPQPLTSEGETGESTAAPAMASSIYNSDSVKTGNKIGTHKTTAEMKDIAAYAGWDFSETWAIFADSNSGYPIFREHVAKNIETATVGIAPPPYTYTGNPIEPDVTVNHGGKMLEKDLHYTLSYSGNVNAGTAAIGIKGANGLYQGTIDTSFTIGQAPGAGSVSIAGWTYGESKNSYSISNVTNQNVKINYTGKSNGGADYNSQDRPTDAGIYTLTATFEENGNYKEHKDSAKFDISKARKSCDVRMSNFAAGDHLPEPELLADYDYDSVSYQYYKIDNGIDVPCPEPAQGDLFNNGSYKVEAVFHETPNYTECQSPLWPFSIIAEGDLIPIPVPTPLSYDGNPKAGVKSSSYYSVSGDVQATVPGTYTTVVKLIEGKGYMWEDHTAKDTSITWSIGLGTKHFPALDTVLEAAYRPSLKLQDIGLPDDYEWESPETSLNAGDGQQFNAIYTDPSGYYKESPPGEVTVSVAKAAGTFPSLDTLEIDYSSTMVPKLANVDFPKAGYTWKDNTSSLAIGTAPHPAIYTDPSKNYTPADGNVYVRVRKPEGTVILEIEGWEYGKTANPLVISSRNYEKSEASVRYTGEANDSAAYDSIAPPKNAGGYFVTATFPENDSYRAIAITIPFAIRRAQGTGTVKVAGFVFGGRPSPVVESGTNGTAGVTFQYKNSSGTVMDTLYSWLPGTYIVEAVFPQTANHTGFTATDTFKIEPKYVTVAWDSCGAEFTYNGMPQSPKATGYEGLTVSTQKNAGSYIATAETSDQGVKLEPSCAYTINPKPITVTWTGDTVFTYNKMNQSPVPSIDRNELHDSLDFIWGGYGYAADEYTGDKRASYTINASADPVAAGNYQLLNSRQGFAIKPKPLKPYFEPVWSEFEYNENRDTIWATTGIFQDSAALQRILDSIVDYKGFAIDTTKAVHDSDNVSVLKGQPKIELKYDVDKTPRYALARRVETTQKATATIITDAISADNYVLDRRTITIMETESDAKTFCENAEGRCIAFSEEICLFLGGTVVSKCNETPIAHTPNPIPYTPAAPHYYSLKGTFLGTQKPTAPGVYIEVRAENFQPQQQRARKIMVK